MTAPSLLDELEGIVRLAEKATPGPFVVDGFGDVTANGEDVARIASDGYSAYHDAHLFADAANFIRARHTEIADMAKRLEAAERDAERYRWLRGGDSRLAVCDEDTSYYLEQLDAIVDAATQEGEG